MNSYQVEQAEAQTMVQRHLRRISGSQTKGLLAQISKYLAFREDVDRFLDEHFKHVCTQKCYQDQRSACCSRDGIITFFADVVVNALVSVNPEIDALTAAIQRPRNELKCIYLGEGGCRWRVKPIVCEMFLCRPAQEEVFGRSPEAEKIWHTLQERRKRFTWPDRPVLFDDLERFFIDAGYLSPLMYLHNSPGLLRIKRRASGGA